MSIIRTAFTSATTGTLTTVSSAMAAITTVAETVDMNAQSLKQISRVGLHNATAWADAAEAEMQQATEDRINIRALEREARLRSMAIELAKGQDQLDNNPKAKAIYQELLGKTKLRVAAE